MTNVITYSRTHSVTYVADNILKSLKDIIRESGLDPTEFVNDTEVNKRGIATWLESGYLETITLEIQAFFATLRDRIHEDWPDPAGLGSPVSERMNGAALTRAQSHLDAANRDIASAINLARSGRNVDALKAWRAFFGPKFPLS